MAARFAGPAIWAITTAFIVFQELLNTLFGLCEPELAGALHLDGVRLGLVGAIFVYVYGVMQIPVGVLFDRMPPQRLLGGAALICAAGAGAFALATGFGGAMAGRGLMGLGAALAFTGGATLMALWYPGHLALLMGLTQMVTAVGGGVGQPLLAAATQTHGWRDVHAGVAALGVVLAIGLWTLVRCPPAVASAPHPPLGPALARVARTSAIWLGAVYASGTVGTVFSYGVIWDFAQQATYGQDLLQSATINGWLFLGFGAGGAALGTAMHRGCPPAPLLVLPALAAAIAFGFIIYGPPLARPGIDLLTGLVGFGCGGSVIAYQIAALRVPAGIRGSAIGLINACAFIAASGLQALHGLVAGGGQDDFGRILWTYPAVLLAAATAGLVLARRPALSAGAR